MKITSLDSMIEQIYKNYFQKSRVFLYPQLDIPRNNKKGKANPLPINTYFSYNNVYKLTDRLLVSHFSLSITKEFIDFEKTCLIGNKLFVDFYDLGNNEGLYMFSFNESKNFMNNWDRVIEGKYSQMSKKGKNKITKYYDKTINYKYIYSFLYPSEYYEEYSKVLDIDKEILKSTVELCDKPNLETEHFKTPIYESTNYETNKV